MTEPLVPKKLSLQLKVMVKSITHVSVPLGNTEQMPLLSLVPW